MALIETEAIVLRAYNFGEADRIVVLFSRDAGRLRSVASGSRRRRNRFGSSLEPLTYLRAWLYERENRDLLRLNSTEILESFVDMQREYPVHVAAQYMAEVCDGFLPERERDDRVFRLLLHALQALKQERKVDSVLVYFNYWVLRLSGFLGDLEKCAGCGQALSAGSAFYGKGWTGLRCTRCRNHQGYELGAAMRERCAQAQGLSLDNWLKLDGEWENVPALRRFLTNEIEGNIEKRLVTRSLLDEALCGEGGDE